MFSVSRKLQSKVQNTDMMQSKWIYIDNTFFNELWMKMVQKQHTITHHQILLI